MVRSFMLFTVLALVFTGLSFADTIQDPNLAQNGEITYVSDREELAANLNDGDFSTNWSTEQTPIFVLDLGAEVEFDFLAYRSYKDRWHSYVVVDTTSGDTLVDRSTNQQLSNTFVDQLMADTLDTPVTARYLKVIVNDGASGWKGCGEFIVKKLNGVYNAPLPLAEGASAHELNIKMQLLDETAVDQWNVYDTDDDLVATAAGDADMVTVDGLEPETSYSYYVGAVVGADEVMGNTIQGTTLRRVTDVNMEALSANRVEISFSDNANDEDGFVVFFSEDGETFASIDTLAADSSSMQVTGLTENTEYYSYVNAMVGGALTVPSDTVSATTMLGATDVAASRYSISDIHVFFTDNGETNTGLDVLYTSDGETYDTLSVDNVSNEPGFADTVMVSGLEPNTQYAVSVQPKDDEGVWTMTEPVMVTTYPLRAMGPKGNILDENFTDGHFLHPRMWHMGEDIGDVGFKPPNNRDFEYGFSRTIAGEGNAWTPLVWGDWDDRNKNGMVDPGEYRPFRFDKNEEVLVFKYSHFGDIATNSTEYYKVQATLGGPKVSMEIGSCYNTKGGTWGRRQLKVWNHKNDAGVSPPDNKWLFPEHMTEANFKGDNGAHTDSTLGLDFMNMVIFRPDSASVNIESWGNQLYGDATSPAPFSSDPESECIVIDHVDINFMRVGLRSSILLKEGVSKEDAQIGLKHIGLAVTKKTDFNVDFVTDMDDFFALARGWGEKDTLRIPTGNPRDPWDEILLPKTMVHGDANNDDVVDEADFDVLKAQFNSGKKQPHHAYPYTQPAPMKPDQRLIAEINTRTGMVSLRGADGTDVIGYKLVSPAGGFSWAPADPMFDGVRTFTATQVGEGSLSPYTFSANRTPLKPKVLGKIYNADINPRDVKLVWQSEVGGETYIGGVTYVEKPYKGVFTAVSGGEAPDIDDPKLFAHFEGERNLRPLKWDESGGRDLGQQFTVDASTLLEEITIMVGREDEWWHPDNLNEGAHAAENDAAFLKLVKCSDVNNTGSYEETIATYYGYMPSELDSAEHRYITFQLPTEEEEGAVRLEPLPDGQSYGFLVGFVSPENGRVIYLSHSHPNRDTTVADYPNGNQLDLSWEQARHVDGSWKALPASHNWVHQLTFWVKAKEIGGVGVEENLAELPTNYDLSQNYPNPFNPTTTISFSLPEPSEVTLSVYDVTGRLVKNVVDKGYEAGIHNVVWDATDNYGQKVATGVYYYRLQANDHVFTKKMMLMK